MSSVPSNPQRRGLGRGFEVLVGGADAPELAHLPVETIHRNPRQPRRRFEPEATTGLADSLKAQGMLQPIVVRPREEGGYELIAGERRWRAAQEAGLATVPAVIRDVADRESLVLALVENVARENLSALEEARAYATLMDEFDFSLGEVATRVGRSKSSVSNRTRLLELPDDVLWMLARGEITEGHARAILAVPDHDERRKLAKRVLARGLSVRDTERAAQAAGAKRQKRPAIAAVDPVLGARAARAAERLTGMKARVVSGKLEIAFADETELEELVEVLERHTA
ncbi:MAG: ParB family transcriptional regulator, chromosome partitioning protein [Gaiellaceae bacterium]|nr:ParB family transcriptional regulator, chromosome partitioning protein [Gaiellaceae bacterium]